MKVTLVQMDIAWEDVQANIATADALIDAAPDSDLYVLPEMWNTGFHVHPEEIAATGPASLRWMQQKADAMNAAIAGSITVQAEDGTYRNRFYFVKPGVEPEFYDKHHLFTYGGEHLRYTAGGSRTIVEWRGVRLLLQVCYDLRFPCFARNRDGLYDAILYVASWPTSRIAAWNVLVRARAIENQCYVLAVGRVGTDPNCDYSGGTQAIDAYGRVVETCPDGEECTITSELDMERLNAFRRKFPVLADSD